MRLLSGKLDRKLVGGLVSPRWPKGFARQNGGAVPRLQTIERFNARRHGLRLTAGLLVGVVMLALAGCGSSSSSRHPTTAGPAAVAAASRSRPRGSGTDRRTTAAGTSPTPQARAPWPRRLGSSYTQVESDNVPYTDQAGQVFEQFVVATGANVLVDTVGYGDIFTKVCDAHPDVYCIQTAPFTKLGPNTSGWFAKLWMAEYTAGVAAGLTTKTNTVGLRARLQDPAHHRRRQRLHHGLRGRQSAMPGAERS